MNSRKRYQNGSLICKKRKNGPDVWVFRFYQGHPRTRKSMQIGTTKDLPSRTSALRAVDRLRAVVNGEADLPADGMIIRSLVERYIAAIFHQDIVFGCLSALGFTSLGRRSARRS
jgi:hypothetical protein